MQANVNSEQVFNSILCKYLEESYKKLKMTIAFLPKKPSVISQFFFDFLKKHKSQHNLFFQTHRSPNKEFSEIEIEDLFKSKILERLLRENFYLFSKEIWKNLKDFSDVLSFEKEVIFNVLMDFLNDMKPLESFCLKALKKNKNSFLKPIEKMKQLKLIIKLEKKNKDDRTFIEVIQKTSENLTHYSSFFLKYYEKVFTEMEYKFEFLDHCGEIQNRIIKFLHKIFRKNEEDIYKIFVKKISKKTENISIILADTLCDTTESNPLVLSKFLKECRKDFLIILKDSYKEELDFMPSDLLVWDKIEEMKKKLEKSFYDKSEKFIVGQFSKTHELELKLSEYFLDYFSEKVKLFHRLLKKEKDLLFLLIISSLFKEKKDEKSYIENINYFFHLKNKYFFENKSDDLEKLYFLIENIETNYENIKIIQEIHYKSVEIWNQTIKEDLNLYSIFCLIMDTQNITPSMKKNIDNKKIIFVELFDITHRLKIKLILRYLQDFKHGYNNYEILNLMEHMLSKMLFPYQNEKLLQLKLFNENFYKQSLNSFVFHYSHSNGNEEFLKDLRNSNIADQQKKTKLLLERIKDLQINNDFIEPPTFFEFEKLSKIETRSRVINICVSGFLSQDSSKRKEWVDLVDDCDKKQMELFSLKWQSSTKDELMEFFSKGWANMQSLSILSSNLPVLGTKMLLDNPFLKSFKEARLTGFYLAHLLGDLHIFGNNAINLIGFSMGTIVIFECLLELDRMRKFQIINDVIVMGGIINRNDFESFSLSMINGRFLHCFSKNDFALKYLFRIVKFGETAIGTKRIEGDKKIENFDCSDLVEDHMGFRKNLKEILWRIDFNQDINYLIEEKTVIMS